jgi:N-acetylmuramoyl-L-alanine amidase
MRSFARGPSGVLLAAVAAWLFVSGLSVRPASAQTARQRYDSALQRDERLRVRLTRDTDTPAPASLTVQVGQVMASFEALVRRFPTSGYADNALWQAATLADAAYQRLNRLEDRDQAIKFYRWLVQEYPSSSLVKPANAKLASLVRSAADTPAAPANRATLTGIERVVLPGTVRITIELDKEVRYSEERLSGPERLFFDLKNVQTAPDLMDKVFTFGSDVVSKIRVGRHPDSTVRVVLDFEEVAKYSVFTLYSPFRLVIDAERAAGRRAYAPPPIDPQPESALAPDTSPALTAAPEPAPPLPATRPEPATSPLPPAANAAGGFSIARQLGLSVSRIVIDPGHGGRDPGTIARGLTEAALTLDVALRLEKLLQKELGVEVVLTRRTDVYVPLEERTALANRHNADLFLSIHVNSSRNTSAKGIETYFLSFASSPEAEAVAARENSASEREMHHLPDLVKAITLNNKLDESRDLAGMVQEALVANLKRSNRDVRSRGVKKAPFVVLIGAAMPSVLAEISFITNKQELQLLKTSAYKDRIAQALYSAVLRYRKSLKGAAATTVER